MKREKRGKAFPKQSFDPEPLLTQSQVSKRMSVSAATTHRLIVKKILPAIVISTGRRSKCYRVRQADLEKFLEERATVR